ncbi:GspE/PulE family protein [Burkholderiaceae bacterium DAT-1]|nr:GspE/PulE family protein [Burkholderiaceae bacterium DAT-1]
MTSPTALMTHLQQALSSDTVGHDWLTRMSDALQLDRAQALDAVADYLGLPTLTQEAILRHLPGYDVVPYEAMLARRVLLFREADGDWLAGIDAPIAQAPRSWISHLDVPVQRTVLVDPWVLDAVLHHYAGNFNAVAAAVSHSDTEEVSKALSDELTLISIANEPSPAVKFVSSTLFDGLRFEASDIHLETIPSGLVVKFRVDGVLINVATLPNPTLAEQVISRVKVLSDLDIAEKRIPQDGRFRIAMHGREIDIRVSIMPSIHGEDAVLRILDKQALIDQLQRLTLDTLGFDEATMALMRRLAAEPYGMLLVTGPTGSGKTTTLYAALSEINTGHDKLITIEDPVEYQLPGVLQIPVNEKKGLTFAVGLRSILRHDPDKILVGEIRDPETAQIAVQSALTGHLVFTSVHANNTFDVIGRFIHMGVDPYSFVSSLTGVVAQRLVRQNCSHCAEPVTPDAALLAFSGISDPESYRFMAGKGCAHCRGTGFKGRRAIAEVLKLSDDIRELIIQRASIRRLKEQARLEGTRFLRDVALELVKAGHTTLQEVNRVTFVA